MRALTRPGCAPFDRYRTIDVVRAVCESSRVDDIALYTGNDDNILVDLTTTYCSMVDGTEVSKRIVGGLLGQNAVWTRAAVDLFEWARRDPAPHELLTRAAQLTDGTRRTSMWPDGSPAASRLIDDPLSGPTCPVGSAGSHRDQQTDRRPATTTRRPAGARGVAPRRSRVFTQRSGRCGESRRFPGRSKQLARSVHAAQTRNASYSTAAGAVAGSGVARCGAVKPADRPSARFFDRLS
ncbi:hypothetical protein E1218_25130 [Kribbella turkmenica]|uniref:Uncharacterized protein n=1 Tax=Kribbella turkmenica TaxID=2530375 RepID=A0A4R4WIK1_9ACTN|nr:hypothetical protein E1218_25130 [Kribbella turkmenica]